MTTLETVDVLRRLRDEYHQTTDATRRDEILARIWDVLARL